MEQPRPTWARRLALGSALLGAAVLVGWLYTTRRGPGAAPDHPAPISATSRTIVVEVRNGTERPGLARQVTKLLRQRGVDVIYFGSAPATDSTTLLVRRGDVAKGHELARLLGIGSVKMAPDSMVRVDVTVLLGNDYRLPKDHWPL